MIFETERLQLRQMEQSDFSALAEMLQDPAVVYAYEHIFTNADVQQWLDRQRARYTRYGFGLWAAVLKETGEMIGQAGLTMQLCETQEVLEIGYMLNRAFWHRGYAREAAQGCRRYAFETLHAEKVYAIIKSDNLPSIRVAESIGMKKEREFVATYYNGPMRHFLFSCKRQLF